MFDLYFFNLMQQHLINSTILGATAVQDSFFWCGFCLTLICIFALGPLSTERIELMKEFDDLLLS